MPRIRKGKLQIDVGREMRRVSQSADARRKTVHIAEPSDDDKGYFDGETEFIKTQDSQNTVFNRQRIFVDGEWVKGVIGDVERDNEGNLMLIVKGKERGIPVTYEAILTKRI